MLYYVPIWFQGTKHTSPIRSGVLNLPMDLSYVAFSFMICALTDRLLHVLCPRSVILMATGTGLLSTLKVKSGQTAWIGYQFLLEAKCVLPIEDIPIGTEIVMFTENLASTVMVSVAGDVFTKQLVSNVARYVPEADTGAILKRGATSIKGMVPSSLYRAVLLRTTSLWINN
ncbi:hypothetical protein DTO271D3_8735 [Paecilomyces variotii]|nr:hypothetical protein DTO271D3_8735 [Paecilomyces variotii]